MKAKSKPDTAHPLLYAGIVVSTIAVFAADLLTRLGIATWIFYIVPILLTLLTRRPMLPIWLALICSLAMVVDYFYSATGLEAWIAQINRGFGLIVLWGTAFLARTIILTQAAIRHQIWLRNAQIQIAERVRGDQTLAQIGDTTLSYLFEYVGAQAGLLYVRSFDRLEKVTSIGISDEAVQSIAPQSGLVARAAERKEAWLIDAIPADYFHIHSGLGSRAPGTLILVPLPADGSTVGVIELGFLGSVHASALELLNLVAEDIGIALKTALLITIRQELLEQTQRQASELQAQQEELRVTNEELQQQSTHLRESQARLELQQAELEQSNSQLEQHTHLLARHNDALAAAKRNLDEKASALEQVNQYKSEFLANMSHELRTPLNSSLILAKLLADNKEGNLLPEQVRFARNIYSAGNDLLELINDILDLAKVETGKIDLLPQNLELRPLCDALVKALRPLAEQRGIRCLLIVDPDAPEQIETDSQRLRQILRNLLSNAIKFTARGEVTLRVIATDDVSVGFAVRDTGIGIDASQQQIIWEPFRQADGTTSRKYGGTGLGLSISRQLSQLLGGHIELESELGVGSTFTLILPNAFPTELLEQSSTPDSGSSTANMPMPSAKPYSTTAAHKPHSHTPSSSPAVADDRAHVAEGDRVLLVVEDDPVFAELIYDLAHQSGFQCLVAGTADEGIELANRHLPAAIVLDVRLPDHSGLSVLDRLKHNSATRHIPVQVVSANDYTQSALEMGAAGVMIKPVQAEDLLSALNALESKRVQETRSVLVVEDNELQRLSVCQLLTSSSVRAIPVATAADALEQLRHATFDCMVLDLALPDASGYELLETMAKDERYSFPPVIVYTGRQLSSEEELRLRKYSTSIIIKGAKSPERLLDEVTLFLHQVEASLPPDRQRMLLDARGREAALENRRILLVEDDVRNVFAITAILEPAGAKVTIARNGREALEALAADRSIDLILMDVMMPEMDGLEATRRIRDQPLLARIPIIALTAKAMADDRKRCLDAGANDYVTKPIDVEKLLSLIRIWLPRPQA